MNDAGTDGTAPNGNGALEALKTAALRVLTESDDDAARVVASRVAGDILGTPSDDDKAIERLARLPLVDYERQRSAAAEKLNVRASILDKLVSAARGANSDGVQGSALQFEEIEPWPFEVNGAQLLDDLAASARRYIVLPADGAEVLALWTLFTYLIDDVSVAPILALVSPEKRCGKSTALSWLGRVVYRPLPASNITAAALFRTIQKYQPCFLIDEADSFLRDSEELRGILNSGHMRDNAYVLRVVGDDFEPQQFTTWCCKAVALIGKLPDTLHDRSIVLEMRRKLTGEHVEKLRHAAPVEFHDLQRRCLRFAVDNAPTVRRARPTQPGVLNDRAADNWEPLFVIANVAGGDWPERAEAAALALSGETQEAPSIGVELLADIRRAFDTTGTDRISGAELVKILCSDAERPWATYSHGKELTQARLARRLSNFGVTSKPIRLPDGSTPRGYLIEQFSDTFTRYVPATSFQSATPPQVNNGAAFEPISKCNTEMPLHFEKPLKPSTGAACGGVALSEPETGTDDDLHAQGWVLEP